MQPLRILKLSDALGRYGKKETSYREDMAAGLAPQLIKIGPRAVGIPEHELNLVIQARIASLTNDEIRKIVSKIHADRSRTAKNLTGGTE